MVKRFKVGLFLVEDPITTNDLNIYIMNRSQEIFQEIENKLVKDDYASTLPVYHPAKGRRKKTYNGQVNTFKGAVDYAPVSGETSSTITSQDPISDPEKKKNSQAILQINRK